ncbi:MAG: methyltransferase domain-containing protein [Thermoleophilia bacterium]|nr:methyltransferase domain-containing protein [Thermoleophilia bacterium]
MSGGPPREWDAAAYHRLADAQTGWGLRVLQRVHFGGDEDVLDAGCGSGRLTRELAAAVPDGTVLAVDASVQMVEEARRNLADLAPRVRVGVADLLDLVLDDPVDVVFSAAVFHHVPDHPRLFRVLLACLRPGGRLVAQCGGGANLAAIREMVAVAAAEDPRLAPLRGWPGPWEFSDAPTAAARLRAAGFTGVRTWVEAAPVDLGDAARFREYTRTVTLRSHLARLGDDDARDALLDAVAGLSARAEHPFTLDHWRLNLEGTRPGAG